MVEGERDEEVVNERMDLWDLSGKEGREAGRLIDFFGTLAPLRPRSAIMWVKKARAERVVMIRE